MTSEGKMLSGYVNKYLNERGNFKTEVCQYSFGMDQPTTEPTDDSTMKGLSVKFPKSARKSTADNSSIIISSQTDNALHVVDHNTVPLPQTAE